MLTSDIFGPAGLMAAAPAATAQRPAKRLLQPALANSGLTQYWRRFHEMGYQFVQQVTKLGRGDKLTELIDLLRPVMTAAPPLRAPHARSLVAVSC